MSREDKRIKSSCDCPMGAWCKHTVALALTFIKHQEEFEFITPEMQQVRKEKERRRQLQIQKTVDRYVYVVIRRKDYLSDGWDDYRNPEYFESQIVGIYDNKDAANDCALKQVDDMGGDVEDESIYCDGLVCFSEMSDESIPMPHDNVVLIERHAVMNKFTA